MRRMKNMKWLLFSFFLGIIFSKVSVYAVNVIMAREVTYTNTDTTKANVQDAIDELYEKASTWTKFKVPLATYLKGKANNLKVTTYSAGNKSEMYTFNHGSTSQTGELIDYRYIGNTPSNYVTFNNEEWRIIGVFSIENENGSRSDRVKIVREDTFFSVYPWNQKSDGSYTNDWKNGSLKGYLNGEYYNSLSVTAQNQVGNARYYLGGHTTPQNVTGEQFYNYERGTNVYSGRSTNDINKIALIYASDYLYTYSLGVDTSCYNNPNNCHNSSGKDKGWLYRNKTEWLLTPRSDNSNMAFDTFANGQMSSYYTHNGSWIHPTLYLKAAVKVVGGTGTSEDPYIIE